ncbi:TolC family outer membrane protein [Arenicellales bacterium nBUS_45]
MRNPKHLLNPVAFIPIVFGTTALFYSVASGETTSYLVKAGDTPCEIAESLKIPCANLIELNNLGSNPVIYPGQTLIVPTDKKDTAPLESVSDTLTLSSQPTTDNIETDVAAAAQVTQSADLLEVYLLAKAQDPVFATQAYRYQAADELIPQAKAPLRPQLSATGSYTDSTQDTNDASIASIALSQSLFNRSSRITVDQARKRVNQAELQYRLDASALVSRTVRAYFTVLAAEDNLELSKKNQAALKRQLELAQERLDVGLGTRTELFDARARFEKAVADTIESEKLVDDATQSLVVLVGQDVGPLKTLPDSVSLGAPQPDDADQWIERALSDNVSLQAKGIGIDLSSLEIDRQKSLRLPTLGVSVSGSYNDLATGDDTSARLLFSVDIPFYQGGLINSKVREAADNLNASRSDYESASRELISDTRQTFLSVKSRLRRLEALSAAVEAGENALVAKEESFAAGLTTNIAVLDAQRDLFIAQRDFLSERYDYILQMLELERLVSDLNEEDVRRVNTLLAPRTP